ncbi:mitochondrial 54S ribosomal protein mL59 KNAG_0K01900 [Huiozyma naganishii CBS 8797]|uniref:Large ribosomal subunit protein mL59 domain-containing protein n=1 Tax=Huiozyma naganishii (strain ATCC MYA-139 / BCRC 22969 / CBS 8797 / KCTC 17520 / NBRC 10181 / NCYC 3082 / Yp74L-3) TaxID=1071383 RepID=J7SA93_HUIN7|nr:hypothetical protein KNAG_0K01900 [Kazachstania naganishii CBS 8797]CCK72554.1 hypothetical protein KNAG_0K01900 [Kazachstania naganishii CBS 8797]
MSSREYFQRLPAVLRRFFERYPPSALSSGSPSPFVARVNSSTGRYADPVYSRRRMAQVYKLAAQWSLTDLLPALPRGKLFFEEKYAARPLLKGVAAPRGHLHELGRRSGRPPVASPEQIDAALAAAGKKRAKRPKHPKQNRWV